MLELYHWRGFADHRRLLRGIKPRGLRIIDDPSRHSGYSEEMHGEERDVGADEHQPKVQLAEKLELNAPAERPRQVSDL